MNSKVRSFDLYNCHVAGDKNVFVAHVGAGSELSGASLRPAALSPNASSVFGRSMSLTCLAPREIDFGHPNAPHNARGIGGLPIQDPRHPDSYIGLTEIGLYRTDTAAKQSGTVAQHFRALGVSLVLDLQTPQVHAKCALQYMALRDMSITVESTPLEGDGPGEQVTNEMLRATGMDKVGIYKFYVESKIGQAGIRDAFLQIAAACELAEESGTARPSIAYMCAHGKDRTGTLTALILDVLNVDRDHIGADYAMSEHGSAVHPFTVDDLFHQIGSNGLAGDDLLVAKAAMVLTRLENRDTATTLLRDHASGRSVRSCANGIVAANAALESTTLFRGREKIIDTMMVSALGKARWEDAVYLLNDGWDLFPSRPKFIIDLLDHLQEKYDSTQSFLENIGVSSEKLDAIRRQFVHKFDRPMAKSEFNKATLAT